MEELGCEARLLLWDWGHVMHKSVFVMCLLRTLTFEFEPDFSFYFES